MTKNLPVMILLMGEVGAGKSTFINTAGGETLSEVGHDLTPCTSTVKQFVIRHHGREVVLVDTPGFNHPTKPDGDVLKVIVDWLKNECSKNIQFGGIIYLHDLSEVREPSRGERRMGPTKLLVPEPHRVILATVDGNSSIAKRRGSQLKDNVWRKLQTRQFMNTQDSAWSILDTFLDVYPIKLQFIQDKLERICNTLPTQSAPRSNRSFFFSLFKLGRK